MFTRILSFALSMFFAASTVYAQDSLGIQSLRVNLGYGLTDGGQTVYSGLAQVDVDVTHVHGLQLDLGLINGGQVLTGQLGAHLYMQPVADQKYGFFAVLSDMDGEAVQYVSAGVEGRVAVSDQLAVDVRLGVGGTTGMGGTSASQWDYVFVGGGVLYAFDTNTTIEARIDVTEFDEETFQAVGIDSQLRLSRRLRSSNFSVYGDARHTALVGRNAMSAITTFGVGITLDLGGSSQSLMEHPFHVATPFDQLVQRGIVLPF